VAAAEAPRSPQARAHLGGVLTLVQERPGGVALAARLVPAECASTPGQPVQHRVGEVGRGGAIAPAAQAESRHAAIVGGASPTRRAGMDGLVARAPSPLQEDDPEASAAV